MSPFTPLTLRRTPARQAALCLALLGSTLLAACASDTPVLDAHWGQSLQAAQTRQSVHPEGSLPERGPIDTSGAVARAGLDRYQQSFEKPPAPVNVLNLGVGTPPTAGGVRR